MVLHVFIVVLVTHHHQVCASVFWTLQGKKKFKFQCVNLLAGCGYTQQQERNLGARSTSADLKGKNLVVFFLDSSSNIFTPAGNRTCF